LSRREGQFSMGLDDALLRGFKELATQNEARDD
jgi:hypothetical protein